MRGAVAVLNRAGASFKTRRLAHADHATAAETTADSRGAVDHRSHDAETAAPGDQTPGPASRRNASTVGDGAANAAPSDAVASAVKQPTPTIPASSGPPQASDAASTGAKTPNRACARAYQPCGGASSPIDHECCEPGYPCTSINPWLRACLPGVFLLVAKRLRLAKLLEVLTAGRNGARDTSGGGATLRRFDAWTRECLQSRSRTLLAQPAKDLQHLLQLYHTCSSLLSPLRAQYFDAATKTS